MSDHRTIWMYGVALGFIVLFGIGAVEAHKGAHGIVKQRMDAMKDMGAIMKDWAAVRKGKAAFKPARVRAQAATMQRHAVEMAGLFPAGSNKGVSEALPAIWQDWQAFTKIATELDLASAELTGSAGAQKSSSLPLMVRIGGTCSSCHKDFRKEKK